jgi:hypothetical protein
LAIVDEKTERVLCAQQYNVITVVIMFVLLTERYGQQAVLQIHCPADTIAFAIGSSAILLTLRVNLAVECHAEWFAFAVSLFSRVQATTVCKRSTVIGQF